MAANSVVIDLQIRSKQARRALQGIESGMTKLRKSSGKATSMVKRSSTAMGQGFNRASQQVQGSTTAVSNLSRIVEDAPFGIRGVANNINPFIQSFQNMGDEATSTGQKMKMLLSSAFTGPGALLTISAIITSTMTAIQMGLFDWGDEAESTDEKMETLMETVTEFIDETAALSGENLFDPLGQESTTQQLEQLRNLRNELKTLFDLREDAEELRQTISTLRQAGTDVQSSRDLLTQQQKKLQEVNTQLERQEGLFGELVLAKEKDIDAELKRLETQKATQQALIDKSAALSLQQTLNQALRPTLRRVELGLSGAQKEALGLRDAYQANVVMLREQIESGQKQGKELEELEELMLQYKEAIEQVDKALDGLEGSQTKLTQSQKDRFDFMERMLEGHRRQQAFEESGLGGTIGNPFMQGQRPEDILIGASGEEFAAGDDSKFGTEFRIDVEFGRTMQEIEKLGEKIGMTDRQIEQMKIDLTDTGDQGEQSMQAITGAANMLGNALAQAIIRGEELEGVLKSLAAQLASRALVTGLGALLTGGSSLGSATFLEAMFGGFAHGTDMGFPGMGKVGERGEELIVAPPFSSIITNENVERMERMREGARNGISAGSLVQKNELKAAIYESMGEMGLDVTISTSQVAESLVKFKKIQDRIGNNHGL